MSENWQGNNLLFVDEYLRSIIEVLNDKNIEGELISLNVGGLLASGQMVSYQMYHNAVYKTLKVLPLGPEIQQPIGNKQTNAFQQSSLFIHLKNTRFFHPAGTVGKGVPSNEGVWWRGRLDRIDGYWFGRLSSRTQSS